MGASSAHDDTPRHILALRGVKGVYYYIAFALLGVARCDDKHPTERDVDALIRSGTLKASHLSTFIDLSGLDAALVASVVDVAPAARGRGVQLVLNPNDELRVDVADRLVRLARLFAIVTDHFDADRDRALAWLQTSSPGERTARIERARTEPGCGTIVDELHSSIPRDGPIVPSP